jgi:hypothetical protein
VMGCRTMICARCVIISEPGSTIMPPVDPHATAAITGSIPPASRISTGLKSPRKDGAMAWMAPN